MARIVSALALALAFALAAAPAPAQSQAQRIVPATRGEAQFSLAPVVKKAVPSVVNVYASRVETAQRNPLFDDPFFRQFFGGGGGSPRPQTSRSLGSGVIVDASGFVVTNHHVIEGMTEIKVALADKREFDADIVLRDPRTDLAVLRLKGATNLTALELGDSDALEVGDFVLAIGNPFGVGQTVTQGIVSALARTQVGISDYGFFVQTDAAINPGNSGGALIDAQGRLIGINTAILSRTGGNQGVGFAVPINLARHVLDQIVKDGKVRRGLLGVAIQDVTPELAKQFNVPNGAGALVGGVTDDSSAAKAGIKPGDVIVSFDGKPVADSRNLKLMVGKASPGAKVEVKVMRDGKEKSFSITLREMPDARADAGAPTDNKNEIDALNGVEVGDPTPETRKQFELPASVKGALVLNVDPTSPAYEAGIRAGDVLLEIDRKPIKNAEDAVEVTRHLKEKRVLALVWTRGASRYVVVDESKIR